MLAKRQENAGAIVIELAPEDYSYEMLSQVLASEAQGSWAKLGAYAVAWKYLILILVMKQLASKGPGRNRGATGEIHKYLRDHHQGAQGNKA